jgi:DNA-binding transcriptional regulator YiaG
MSCGLSDCVAGRLLLLMVERGGVPRATPAGVAAAPGENLDSLSDWAETPDMTGRELRQMREEYGMTQEAAAEVLGTSARTLIRWEAGEIKLGRIQSVGIRVLLTNRRAGESRSRREAMPA